MRKQEAKRINQTFSLPPDVSKDLHVYVRRREMSQFVSEAIRKELEFKKEELKKDYLAANKDENQREVLTDWETTLGDGLENESNEW